MKLNLLPSYIRQAKRNRNALVLMVLLVLVTAMGFGYWTLNLKSQHAQAKQLDANELSGKAAAVVARAREADAIYEDNKIVFRNVELSWYIEEHNKKYPDLYRKVARRLPSYVRLTSVEVDASSINFSTGAQPPWPGMKTLTAAEKAGPPAQPAQFAPTQPAGGGGQIPGPAMPPGQPGGLGAQQPATTGESTCTVRLQAILGNYQQYSDVMIALVRGLGDEGDFVTQVSREGFRQNQSAGGGFDSTFGMGPGIAAPGGVGTDTTTGARPPMPNYSTVNIVAVVKYNLVPPNPLAALQAIVAGGGAGSAGPLGGAAQPGGAPGGIPGPPGFGTTGPPPGPGPGAGQRPGTGLED